MKTEILFLSLFSVFSVVLLKNNNIDPKLLAGIPSTIFLSSFSSVLSFILGNILVRGKLSNLVSLKLPSKFLINVVSKTPPIIWYFFSSVGLPLFLPKGTSIDLIYRLIFGIPLFYGCKLADISNTTKDIDVFKHYLEIQKKLLLQTSLASIFGILDILGAIQTITAKPKMIGKNIEGYILAGIIYIVLNKINLHHKFIKNEEQKVSETSEEETQEKEKNTETNKIIKEIVSTISIIGISYYFIKNVQTNLEARGISSGFDFLGERAGFGINEKTLFSYSPTDTPPTDTHKRAILIGIMNTIKVVSVSSFFTYFLRKMVNFSDKENVFQTTVKFTRFINNNTPFLLKILFLHELWISRLPKQFPEYKNGIPIGKIRRFSNRGINVFGIKIIPEFIALCSGLIFHHATYSAPKFKDVIISILTKSSLGIAIGYPDIISITGGVMLNQTGRAIECLLICIIIYYLKISLINGVSSFITERKLFQKVKDRIKRLLRIKND
jgi:ABC-type amino acid transport system permease subunit